VTVREIDGARVRGVSQRRGGWQVTRVVHEGNDEGLAVAVRWLEEVRRGSATMANVDNDDM